MYNFALSLDSQKNFMLGCCIRIHPIHPDFFPSFSFIFNVCFALVAFRLKKTKKINYYNLSLSESRYCFLIISRHYLHNVQTNSFNSQRSCSLAIHVLVIHRPKQTTISTTKKLKSNLLPIYSYCFITLYTFVHFCKFDVLNASIRAITKSCFYEKTTHFQINLHNIIIIIFLFFE